MIKQVTYDPTTMKSIFSFPVKFVGVSTKNESFSTNIVYFEVDEYIESLMGTQANVRVIVLNSGALSLEIISNEFTDDATLALRNWIVANHIDVPAVLEDVANYIYHTWDTGGDARFLYAILRDDRCCTCENIVDAGLIGDQPPTYAILENEKIMKAKENENTAASNKTVTENSSFNMSFKAITTNENTIGIHISERYNSNFTTGLSFNDIRDFDAFVDFLIHHKNNTVR